MKKIILIIFVSLMFSNIGFAEIRFIEEKIIEGEQYWDRFGTYCIDGYKFVYSGGAGHGDTALSTEWHFVQAFEERDGKSLPTKC